MYITLGIELKAGRDFSPEFPRDSLEGIILNQTAVNELGLTEPVVGQQIIWAQTEDTTYFAYVVGVVQDFNFASLHSEIKPFGFVLTPSDGTMLAVKIKAENLPETLNQMELAWNGIVPDRPFDFYFLDESIDELYRFEANFREVFSWFTGLGIFIACLGLLGLATFMAERRVKEIGIRKVLGATTIGLVGLLSRDFLKLVLIALLIAAPVAYYFMDQWLQDFAYRVEIQWWLFALAGAAALLIAFFTVGFQSVRAALADPVESLRSE